MPPAVTRELSITYAGYQVGGTQGGRLLDGKYRMTRSYERSSISFTVVINAATEADFATECATLEAAYRTPRGALTVTLGAVNLIAVTHTGSTGFNASPSASKSGGDKDTGRSRSYDVTIDFTEPADLAGQNGRRTSTVSRSYDPSRKATITITGTYTAIGATSAQAQYASAAATYFAAVLSAFGGTYEKVSEETGRDDADKELSFTVVFREVIFNQAVGVLDHAGIVEPRLTVAFSRSSPGDSPEGGARRLSTIVATFETSVDKTVVTDLKALYSDTIRPFIIQQAKGVAGGGVALVNEDYNLNGSDYRIAASVTFLAVGTSATIEYDLTVELRETLGRRLVPVWGNSPYEALVIPNPANRRRIVVQRIVELGNNKALDPAGPTPMDPLSIGAVVNKVHPQDGQSSMWVTLEGSIREGVRTLGDGDVFDLTERTTSFEQQWVETPSGTTGGGTPT